MRDLRQQIRENCVEPLSPEEERELIAAAQAGLEDACARLLTAFLPLVWQIAEEGVADAQVEDAIGEGVIGLCAALRHFDAGRCDRFAPFAAKSVVRTIRRWARSEKGVRISRRKGRASYVKDAELVSLDDAADGFSLHDVLGDPKQRDEDSLIGMLDSIRVYDALQSLTPTERAVIEARYKAELTCEDIAVSRNCSKQAVQQTEARAVAKLRAFLTAA